MVFEQAPRVHLRQSGEGPDKPELHSCLERIGLYVSQVNTECY